MRGVSLAIAKGAITGIVGENGAGKSTLMSILYGLYRADAGEIRIDGQPCAWTARTTRSPTASAWSTSISCWSTPSPCWRTSCWAPRAGRCWRAASPRRAPSSSGWRASTGSRSIPTRRIADLPVGEQQRVEILKVLYRGAEILILDEPSAVLTPQETDQLFRILATLQGARRHHHADHPQAARDHGGDRPCLCHARRARSWPTGRTAETNPEELAELMVGRKVRLQLDKTAADAGRGRC